MKANEFKAWRARVGLTQRQIADRLGVTRQTIQNWESAVSPIPQAVDMSCATWEARLKQEDANLGPVTLVYSDGPMFVNAYGPRRRPAIMQQEPYPTNAAAIARVEQLWSRDNFHNAFILEESGAPLWNIIELARVVSGEDRGAPTLANLLRAIAMHLRNPDTCSLGPDARTSTEANRRQQAIEAQAGRLERLAGSGLSGILRDQLKIEGILSKLPVRDTKAPGSLVLNVAQAFAVFQQARSPIGAEPRLEQGGHVLEYKGYEITYQQVAMFPDRWIVNLCSTDPHLLNRIGGRAIVVGDHASLEEAIAKAKRYVDQLS
jgi:transcriptional regulator with XRE-family HTH domain